MTQLETVLISSVLAFIMVFGFWFLEWRFAFIMKFINAETERIRSRIHEDDRAYYEHRKNINARIGHLEEKVGYLDNDINNAKLEVEIKSLEQKLSYAKFDKHHAEMNAVLSKTATKKRAK